jgi:hypothetical protein
VADVVRRSRPAAQRARLVPDQHGAWGFLALPLALALTRTGIFPLLVPATVTWVAAYPLSWSLTGRFAARRPERFDRAVRLWGPVTMVTGAPVLWWRPWLLWVVAAYAALWLLNVAFARARQERSLANDLVLAAECTMGVPVFVGIARGGGWEPPWTVLDGRTLLLVTACAVALVGSVLHVKSLIRERADPRYRQASRAFAIGGATLVLVVAASSGEPVWAVVPFGALVVRSWFVPAGWRPVRVGLVELAGLLLVVLAFATA